MPPDVLDLFSELAAVPSPPGEERAVADLVLRYLRDCGLEVDEDGCGPEIGSTMGNLYARLEPTAAGEPLLLCAHLDTVPPTAAIEPVVEDGVVRNAAGTILGADNKAAVAAMLEAIRVILAERRPHAGIELLFTPKEEVGLVGAYAFDHTRLRARTGYVYDQAAPIGVVILGAPYLAVARGDLPRPRGALGHAPGGRPVGDRRGGARDLGAPARTGRRGLDGERRHDLRRHRDEHRPGVVHVRRRGALARRAQARRPDPGDAGRDHVRRRRRRVRRRDEGCARATAATASRSPTGRSRSPPPRWRGAATPSATSSPAAPRTRTSSTSAGSSA